ncbi:MAG: sugar ABC transporter permease [Devosia sp.]|nr:sugar ABC transporter permease [Devosia sp.]
MVDGANSWQRFWNVTLPGIMPVIIVTTLLSSIWTANGFEHVWLLTPAALPTPPWCSRSSPTTACRPSASARPRRCPSTCCRCSPSW